MHKDAEGHSCVFCSHGVFRNSTVSSRSSVTLVDDDTDVFPTSRQLFLQEGYSHIYLVGSSNLRHLYLNFVESFRRNHNFTNDTYIEQYFHCSSKYRFNGTHDYFWIEQGGGEFLEKTLPNVLLAVDLVWDPKLTLHKPTINRFSSQATSGRTLVVVGNMFWNFEFHNGCQQTILEILNATTSRHGKVFWLDPWDLEPPHQLYQEKNKWVRNMNAVATKWFQQQERFTNLHQLNMMALLQRDYSPNQTNELYHGHRMQEDGIHFQCNFIDRYPSPIQDLKRHKHQRWGGCLDPVDDILWTEMHRLVAMNHSFPLL